MKKWQLSAIILLIALLVGIFGGWNLHKNMRPCPAIIQDTVYVWDTVEHIIIDHVPHYITNLDTIIFIDTILQQVDTAEILKDYFALHVYDRKWQDSTILVNLKDTISENKSIGNEFEYKLLKPQTTIINNIDNSITYSRYLSGYTEVNLSDFKTWAIGLYYQGEKVSLKASYVPQMNSFNVGIGTPIIKFKKIKK